MDNWIDINERKPANGEKVMIRGFYQSTKERTECVQPAIYSKKLDKFYGFSFPKSLLVESWKHITLMDQVKEFLDDCANGGSVLEPSKENLHFDLLSDIEDLASRFKCRYKSLEQLKGRHREAKTAKRAYLDLNKIIRKHTANTEQS